MKRIATVGLSAFALLLALLWVGGVEAHIVPPEQLHPVAESYRRASFLLRLNPVPWSDVGRDTAVIAEGLAALAPTQAAVYRREVEALVVPLAALEAAGELPEPAARKAAAKEVLDLSSHAVGRILALHMTAARDALAANPREAKRHLETARGVWAAFEPQVAINDPSAYQEFGESWLELTSALGNPGILGVGVVEPDVETFHREVAAMIEYIEANFGPRKEEETASTGYVPVPLHSSTYARGPLPLRLPPGSEINKQLPRPRQILNMAQRGVNETETPLIALGDMAFDSPMIFGEPARSLNLSCNTCHNKGVTNPKFFIPGLSSKPGTVDVSNSFFAPHANNGHFDPVDIPDLRGVRFTAPYGRNGRFESLREFTRNVIVNEFNGPEPDPLLLDGLVAYMVEFDFLPNPALKPDGALTADAPAAARRGEAIFHRPFESMGGRACATCHVPSDNFLDRKRHDIGSVDGAGGTGEASRDRALDTPTLLGITHTAPYFHDGRLDTLEEVVEWFDERYTLKLSEAEVADLTAYLKTVGDGVDAYEDTVYTLASELEEFSFFLSAYDTLKARGKNDLVGITLETAVQELRFHKWDVQDPGHMPTLDRMVDLLEEARTAHQQGDVEALEAKLAEYWQVYEENVEVLR